VVEDDEGVTKMLRVFLRSEGFETTEVTTGGEALHILEHQPPDATVLDLGLPDDQGKGVLDWLRQHDDTTSSSPVWVAISALDRQETTKRYGPLGSHFLAKPFDPWRLVAMLGDLLSAKGRPFQP